MRVERILGRIYNERPVVLRNIFTERVFDKGCPDFERNFQIFLLLCPHQKDNKSPIINFGFDQKTI